MPSHRRTQLHRSLAAGIAVAALAAPAAQAGPIIEPGLGATPQSTADAQTTTTTIDEGVDWSSAATGAGGAGAHEVRKDHDAVVAPAKDKWLGEVWAQIYSLPVSENPFAGNGNPCLTVGHKVIQEIGGPCTVEEGTALTLGFGTAWSNAEDPFPETRREQLAIARAADHEAVAGMTVTVDGGDPVEIRNRRFELFSPQRTVLLPADNVFGLDGPRTVTLSAHAWAAVIRKLSVGEHEIVGDTRFTDGTHFVVPHIITVVARAR